MRLDLQVQRVCQESQLPTDQDLSRWAEAALLENRQTAGLLVRIVDAAESQQLNRDYRAKDKSTNVLSFPFETPPGVPDDQHLGDLVICASVVENEAAEQGKDRAAHWAHMLVHGVLHLQGYDHLDDHEAEQMETLEREILAGLGYSDPYREI